MIASHYLLLRRTKPTHLAQGGSFSLEAVLPGGRRDSIGLNRCPVPFTKPGDERIRRKGQLMSGASPTFAM